MPHSGASGIDLELWPDLKCSTGWILVKETTEIVFKSSSPNLQSGYPNLVIQIRTTHAQWPGTFTMTAIAGYSEPGLHPVPLPLQYHQPLLWSILGKETPPETFKKKSLIPKCQQHAYIIRTLISNIRQQQQWGKPETLCKVFSGASPAGQTRPECNP